MLNLKFPMRQFKLVRSMRSRIAYFSTGTPNFPPVRGEKLLTYLHGSPERQNLKKALADMFQSCPEIPCVVNGEEIKTGNIQDQIMPSLKSHVVSRFHLADKKLIQKAIDVSLKAKKDWENVPFIDKSRIYFKAAEILSLRRAEICASVMIGTGKTVWQAEIDAGAEAIDFLRISPHQAKNIYDTQQPPLHTPGSYNRIEHRSLEGFVAAISPFNFCAIGINLPAAPALMGNVVVWKPSKSAILGNYLMFQALVEAGLPPGVINFVPSSGADFAEVVLDSPHLAGVHFTGSTKVFNSLWEKVGSNIGRYRSYPRLVGETGGKNFHFAHSSADATSLLHNTIRSAFEYCGQKCSALSRLYVPKSMWENGFRERLVDEVKKIKIGQPDEFDVFMSAVIDQKSFDRSKLYLQKAADDKDCEVLVGGTVDDSKGFFVHPTVIEVKNPESALIKEEIFAPILSVRVYEDSEIESALEECSEHEYGLTGAIFGTCPKFLRTASDVLKHSAGNFYINDKCTGAVVGEQPFGGARKSGTNDKAGSEINLSRWVSPRTIKENFTSLESYKYPYMK